MKRFYSIILSLSLAVCLSSCAYVQKGTGYLSDGGKYVGRQAGDAGRWVGGVFTPKPSSEVADIVVSSKDLADLQQDDFETSLPLEAYGRSVAAQTGGAVEVFSLDGGSGGGVTPVRISPDLPVVHNSVSRRVPGSSSVEVFPLPGGAAPQFLAPVSDVIAPLERPKDFASPFDLGRKP